MIKLTYNQYGKSRILAFLMVIFLVLTVYCSNTSVYGLYSKEQDRLDIVLTKDKSGLTANGINIPCIKPFISANLLYVPMNAVLETLGADIETNKDGAIKVTFRDMAAEIKVGSKNFALNQEKRILSAPPMLSGNIVMIPLDFIKLCFNASTTYDPKTGRAVISLKDDGALSDLSFLTGSITTAKAGNSYFGWSIAMPRGSRVAGQSFNSKSIQMENEHYEIALEVAVNINEGKTLQQYYDQIIESPYSILPAEPVDSQINLDTTPQYIELLYTDSYDEAVYERIYAKGNNFIHAVVTSYNEADPSLLKNNNVVISMLNSFSLMYKGNESDTADISKVNFGLAQYNNYITSESTGKKYLTWEMNILPEWDLETGSQKPFNTQFNGITGEFIRIELNKADDKAEIGAIGNNMISLYSRNFNSDYYSLRSSAVKQTAGYKSYSMQYEVKSGNKRYSYDERLILLNGIVYDITFRAPLELFEKEREHFEKMLETFKPSTKDTEKILTDLQKNDYNLSKNRAGKDNSKVVYENKAFNWKLKLPGYWQKSGTPGQSLESFYDKNAGAVVMVEASALKGNDADKSNQERFLSMNLSDEMTESPVETHSEQYKNTTVTVYKYRIEDAENETFADVNYYIFDKNGYRYCFTTTIPDLTSSEFNLNSLKDIWNSFEITE